jgi:hypothetical protein
MCKMESAQAQDRRRGPRRVDDGTTVDCDRRRTDRRKRRPGLAALFGAIVGARRESGLEASMSSADLS